MPRTRRDRGDGTFYFDDRTQRWVGQLDLGRDHTGKRHRPKVTGRTRAERRIKLLDLRAKPASTSAPDPGTSPTSPPPGSSAACKRTCPRTFGPTTNACSPCTSCPSWATSNCSS